MCLNALNADLGRNIGPKETIDASRAMKNFSNNQAELCNDIHGSLYIGPGSLVTLTRSME